MKPGNDVKLITSASLIVLLLLLAGMDAGSAGPSPPSENHVQEASSVTIAPFASISHRSSSNETGRTSVREHSAAKSKGRTEKIFFRDKPGALIVFSLPRLIDERKVVLYRMVQTPALSLLYQRTFFWRSTLSEVGVHGIVFSAELEDGAIDTLVAEVTLLPRTDD